MPVRDDLRPLADHDHEERDQRRGNQHDNARERVDRKDDDQDADWHQRSHDKLRKILAVIGIQRFDPLDRGRGQLAGALPARVGGTQVQNVLEEPVPQVGFDTDGDNIGADLINPSQKCAPGNEKQDQLQPGSYLGKGLSLQVNAIDRTAEQVCLGDDQQAGQKSGKNGE